MRKIKIKYLTGTEFHPAQVAEMELEINSRVPLPRLLKCWRKELKKGLAISTKENRTIHVLPAAILSFEIVEDNGSEDGMAEEGHPHHHV